MCVDWTKPIQTKSGGKVRVICTDRKNSYFPVVVLHEVNGREKMEEYTLEGGYLCNRPSEHDIINVPKRHENADLIIAWANGAKVQQWNPVIHAWEDDPWPPTNTRTSYRLKP